MNSEKKVRRITPTFVNGMYLFMLIFYVVGAMGVSVVLGILDEMIEDFSLSIIGSLALSQALIWCGMLLVMLVARRNPFLKTDFKFKSGAGKTLATFALLPIFVMSVLPVTWFLNLVTMFFVENAVADVSNSIEVYPLVVQLLAIAVMPAVSEELICRGALFGGLKRHGILKAVIISSLFFGVLHLNINQFAYATVLGIAFAILNECSGNIYTSMAGHFMVNGFSVVLTYIMSKVEALQTEEVAAAAVETAEAVSIADMPLPTKIIMAMMFGFMALMGLAFAFLTAWAIAAINGRAAHVKGIFKKGSVNPYAETVVNEEGETVEAPKKRMFEVFFWLSMAIGFAYMIVTEFLL